MWLWRYSYNKHYKIVLVGVYSGNLWLLALATRKPISPQINIINRKSFPLHKSKTIDQDCNIFVGSIYYKELILFELAAEIQLYVSVAIIGTQTRLFMVGFQSHFFLMG